MVKLSKFYIALACSALCVFGCGQEAKEPAKEQEITEQAKVETTKKPEEATQETEEQPEEVQEPEEEVVLHPVSAEGIDYLSTDGIELEAGTEIAMVATSSSNSFYSQVKKGASAAVSNLNKALGYTGKGKLKLSYAAPKNDSVIEQINIIDQFLDKAPDAICIAFSDATASKTQIQMAKNNGIQLIAFDTPEDSKAMEALVATDNYQAATEAAGKLFNAVNYQGKIAVIVHSSLTQTGLDRYRAITSEFAQKYGNKDLRFVDVIYLAQDNRSEKEILDELLEKHPDLSGIICTDLSTTEMVINYTKKLKKEMEGKPSFRIVGFDVSEKIINAVKDGTVLGTVAQDPYSMGYATVIAAARSVAGMENAETIHTSHLWIDSSNLDSEEAKGLLNY